MSDKKMRITDVDSVDSLQSNESFFINQNNAIKQINKNNIVFGIINGGTGATDVDTARANLGAADSVTVNEMKTLLTELTQTVSQLSGIVSQLSEEVPQLNSELEKSKTVINEHGTKIEEISGIVKGNTADIDELVGAVKKNGADIIGLTNSVDSLGNALKDHIANS